MSGSRRALVEERDRLRAEVDCLRAERKEIGASHHKWTVRDMDVERASVVAWLRALPCTAEGHDPRWCAACVLRSDLADAIEAGDHTEGT